MTPENLRIAIIRDVLTGRFTDSKNVTDLKGIDKDYFSIYQIPSTWDVVTLKECCYLHARIGWQALRKTEHMSSGDYLLVTGTDFKNGFVDYSTCSYVSKERYDMDEKIQLRDDDILVTKDGSIGKVAVVKSLPKPATLNAGVFVVRPDDRFEKRYIEYLFQCSYFSRFVNLVKSGSTIKHLNQNKLLEFKIPVPTKKEQREIIDLLDEWLPRVDEFERLDKRLKTLNTSFSDMMKKSILQEAVQGKLVPQDPNDEPASELLKKIAEEKKRLIKEGKIPKEKKLATISDEEKKYTLPNGWEYVRVQDIASYITDYVANGSFKTLREHTKTFKEPNYAIFVRTMDLSGGFNTNLSYIDKESYDYLSKSKLYGGELILPNIGGSIGKAFIMPCLEKPMSLAPNSIMIKFMESIMNRFFAYVIQSPYGNDLLVNTKGGTVTPKFSKTELRNLVIMLPPLEEQKRIVDKIEKLMTDIDKMAR